MADSTTPAPACASIDTVTGLITFNPTGLAESGTITVTVTNSVGLSTTTTFTLNVICPTSVSVTFSGLTDNGAGIAAYYNTTITMAVTTGPSWSANLGIGALVFGGWSGAAPSVLAWACGSATLVGTTPITRAPATGISPALCRWRWSGTAATCRTSPTPSTWSPSSRSYGRVDDLNSRVDGLLRAGLSCGRKGNCLLPTW